jgi:hypothetical protein
MYLSPALNARYCTLHTRAADGGHLSKLPACTHGMLSPLPAHATGNKAAAQEVARQGVARAASRRMLELPRLSWNSRARRRKRARAVLTMKGMRSTPMARSCSA